MQNPFIIGIAGGSGAGKSTVAQLLADHFKNKILLLAHDRYYRDQSHLSMEERKQVNYDHPSALETSLFVNHLSQLIAGNTVEVPMYDFTKHNRSKETELVRPKSIIVVEGIMILKEEGIRGLLDLKVYVQCDNDMRLGRRAKRDMEERKRTLDFTLDQYFKMTRVMHNKYVEPSKAHADLIIPWEKYNKSAVQTLIDMIELKLNQAIELPFDEPI